MTYKKAKELLRNNSSDVNMIITRYMFEKFGTLPETVVEMDDYNKAVIFAILEDIAKEHEKRKQSLSFRKPRYRRV